MPIVRNSVNSFVKVIRFGAAFGLSASLTDPMVRDVQVWLVIYTLRKFSASTSDVRRRSKARRTYPMLTEDQPCGYTVYFLRIPQQPRVGDSCA